MTTTQTTTTRKNEDFTKFTSYIAARTCVAVCHERGLAAVVLPRDGQGFYWVQS